MQIIPAIDLRGGRCVRLQQGDYARETVYSADPVEVACRFCEQGATRLHLVDLDAARAGEPVNHQVIARIVQSVAVPCQAGGGLRNDASVKRLLEEAGVERIVVGTQALRDPPWFRRTVERYPGRVALGLDARNSLVATAGWCDVSETPALELAAAYADLARPADAPPLAAVIYTNIANDGMLQGVDEGTLDDLLALAGLGFRVIASGGVTTADDVRRLSRLANRQPRLVGAIVGRALYEGKLSVAEAIQAATSES